MTASTRLNAGRFIPEDLSGPHPKYPNKFASTAKNPADRLMVGFFCCSNRRSAEEVHMNRKIALVAASLFALVAAPAAMATPQQDKMKSCNASATGKKGDERKAFMKECLSADSGKKGTSQQEKMKSCNVEAKTKALKGDERKKFMSNCLKG
jgi:hypothetical protein